eukprot:4752848-Lingulodinium_polyedra.AAC.1
MLQYMKGTPCSQHWRTHTIHSLGLLTTGDSTCKTTAPRITGIPQEHAQGTDLPICTPVAQ